MKKILVTDLFDTLLPNTPAPLCALYGMQVQEKLSNEYYEYVEKYQEMAMQDLIIELKEYLKDDNELVVVTNLDHMSLDLLVDRFISRILEELSEYKKQIKFYLVGRKGDITHTIPNKATVSEKDGNICIDRNGTKLGYLLFKEEVFNYIDINDKELHTIGDEPRVDLGMLLKGVELNGNSSIIDLYSSEKANEEYKDNTLTREIKFYLENFDLKEKADRLIELCNNKELSVEELYRIKFLYKALNKYNFSRVCPPYRRKAITDKEYIKKILEKIQIIPSFKDFSKKLIMKN